MSITKVIDVTLTAPASSGLALAQQTAGAANLVLNGTLIVGGKFTVADVVYIDLVRATQGCPKKINLTTTEDDSLVNATVTGTLSKDGPSFSETIALGSTATVTTVNYFYSVTNIAVDGAIGADMHVGTSQLAESPIVFPDYTPGAKSVSVEITSGTCNVTLQHTFDPFFDYQNTPGYNQSMVAWNNNDANTPLVGLTTGTTNAAYISQIRGLRLITASYSSTPRIKLRVAMSSRGSDS